MFLKQLNGMACFYGDAINLEREGGINKESTLTTLDKHCRRFMGFLHNVLGYPLDLRYCGDGVQISTYITFLKFRKAAGDEPDGNLSYLSATLAQVRPFLPEAALFLFC